MEDWKQRVVDEYKQLLGRYERLSAMIDKYESGQCGSTLTSLRYGAKLRKLIWLISTLAPDEQPTK